MPEGPEVSIVVDGLNKYKGTAITALYITTLRPWIFDKSLPARIGDPIREVKRKGKFILIEHESKITTVVHLSFTGSFSLTARDYLAADFQMSDGRHLFYHDKRGLSRWVCMTSDELEHDKTLSHIGLDGLVSSREAILSELQRLHAIGLRTPLKPFLLDYQRISGIGNIYGSEICFEARLSPVRPFNSLTAEELSRLATAIPLILRRAYTTGGSSIEDFVNLEGKNGHAQDWHKVYGKVICQECGGPIIQMRQSGRSTYFCPKCQEVEG